MKNRLIWLSIFFTVSFWIFLLPIYSPSLYMYAAIFLFTGIASLILAFLKIKEDNNNRMSIYACYRITPKALYYIFTLLIYQILVIITFVFFAASTHDVNCFLYPTYWFLQLLGYNCSLSGNILNVWNTQFVVPFTSNHEKLALLPFILLFTGTALSIYFSRINKKILKIFWIFILIMLLITFRFALLITVFLEYEDIYQQFPPKILLFIDPWLTLFSLGIITFLLSNVYNLNLDMFFEKMLPKLNNNRLIIPYVMFSIGVFFCCGAFLFQEPGKLKNGKILFDDLHSKRWEKSTVTMGKYDFGGEIVYSYSSLVYWLRHYYHVDVNTNRTLNNIDLNEYSVLILKTPAFRYTKDEIKSIIHFVKNGGGLFLIGDHSNLLGMTTFLNQIAHKFNFSFNYDSSNQFSTNLFTEYCSYFPFSHPTVMGLNYFSFLTSCTLNVPLSCERSMIAFDAFSDTIDYSKPSFFGDIIVKPDNNFGLFILGASKKISKGRITLFTDSTVFSNFCLFVDGHDRYFLNSLNYLNRENIWGYKVNCFLAAIGFLLIFSGCLMSYKNILNFVFWVPLLLFIFISLSVLFWGGINHFYYKSPNPNVSMIKVAFLDHHTEFYLPPGLGTPILPFDVSFDTFFMTTQRLGLFPFYTRHIDDATENAHAIVIINPIENYTDKEKLKLYQYIKNGGKLLVLDTINNRKPHLRCLAEIFDIKVKRTMKQIEFSNGQLQQFNLNDKDHTFKIQTTLCHKRIGKGIVIFMSDSLVFSRASMGGVLDNENKFTNKIFNIAYDIFENKFKLKPNMVYP